MGHHYLNQLFSPNSVAIFGASERENSVGALVLKNILSAEPDARNVSDNWKNMTKVMRPKFDAIAAREVGITKSAVDDLLLTNFVGKTVGVYREGTERLPIVVRMPEQQRNVIDSIEDMQIYSPVLSQYVPLSKVISDFTMEFEDPIINRRDRKRTLTVMADHDILSDNSLARSCGIFRPLARGPCGNWRSGPWCGKDAAPRFVDL